MKYLKQISFYLLYAGLHSLLISCDSDFLDKKPRKSLVVPETIADYQALLDNVAVMNSTPGLVEVSADDFVISTEGWNTLNETERNTYLWEKDLYGILTVISDWNTPYQQVFYSNVVLDGIGKIKTSDTRSLDELKGSALFFRAWAFFHLAQQFAMPYSAQNAGNLPGIPVRTTSDVDVMTGRGNIEDTYDRIVEDLQEALTLLPISVPSKTRPSKPSAAGLLAQVYLHMGDYEKALAFSTECLSHSHELLEYSMLNPSLPLAFPVALPSGNSEVIFYSTLINFAYFNNALTQVDPELYASYKEEDLRKSLYFEKRADGTVRFRGSYTGTVISGSNGGMFSGIAADEIYLLRAEANARLGNLQQASDDLNHLLSKRLKKDAFTPVSESSSSQLLLIILEEKRKELVGRGKRWSELRRLNLDPALAKNLSRDINGQRYDLPANSNRYTFPIPQAEISLNPMEQNPR